MSILFWNIYKYWKKSETMRLDIVVVISFWVGTFTHTNGVHCFIVPHPKTKLKVWKPLQVVQQEEDRAVVLTEEVNATPSRGVSAGASTNTANTVNDEATRLRKEAEMIRLQAEKMDLSLTLDKISSLESKLQNKSWLAKHPEKEQELRDQLQRLNDKLRGPNDEPQTTAAPTKERSEFKISEDRPELRMSSMSPTRSTSSSLPTEQSDVGRKDASWRGFVESEIELYLPVIARIERDVPNNATIDEKVESFKRAPELQDYFRSKIENLLSIPLEEAFKIEDLKDQYLESTSTKERENLKRQIDRIEGGELVGPFKDPDPKGYYCDYLTPLSDEEVKKRAASIATLPDTLIAIYMKGKGLEFDVDDLETAVLYEYYEPQLQLLEKPRYVEELTHDEKEGYKMGYQSLPKSIRDRFAEKLGLPPDSTSDDVLEKVVTETGRLSSLINFSQPSSSENRDIEYIDRSRYLSELFTNIASMEADRPSEEDVKLFATDILDNKFFMLSSKPERVSGGYYIRGTNRLADDDGSSSNTGSLSAGDRLVAQIQERLDKSPLAEKLQFYYIMDPSPPYDEEIELAIQKDPILVVTGKNSSILYDTNEPKIKGIISSAGVFAAFLYAVGACVLNPTIADRFDQSINAVASTGVLDLQWFGDVFFPLFLGLGATQLVHEAAHRIVAAYYKVRPFLFICIFLYLFFFGSANDAQADDFFFVLKKKLPILL